MASHELVKLLGATGQLDRLATMSLGMTRRGRWNHNGLRQMAPGVEVRGTVRCPAVPLCARRSRGGLRL
jgi:hypothetical protein